MDFITTTQLRTNTKELIQTLKNKGQVRLIHRSQIVGTIQPAEENLVTITDSAAFGKFLDGIKPKNPVPRQDRDKIYRQHLKEKYGKNLP